MKLSARRRKAQLKGLRQLIDNSSDPIEQRIAYAMHTAVTYVTADTVGWSTLKSTALGEAHLLACILRNEQLLDAIRIRRLVSPKGKNTNE